MNTGVPAPPPGRLTRRALRAGGWLGALLGLLAALLSASAEWVGLSVLMVVTAPIAGAFVGVLLGAVGGFLLDFAVSAPTWVDRIQRPGGLAGT